MNKKSALFFLNLLLIFVLSGSSSIAQEVRTAKSAPSINKSISKTKDLSTNSWSLIAIKGLKAGNTNAFIEFNSTEKRFTGNGSCNQMFGKFETIGNTIKLSGIGTTRMFCSAEGVMKLESDFIKALEKVNRFKLQGDSLNLFAGNKLVLKFSRTVKRDRGNVNSNAVKLEDRK